MLSYAQPVHQKEPWLLSTDSVAFCL